ncbi:MAG: hypothetical protein ACM37W_17500 [Actinomycetota bacterium]
MDDPRNFPKTPQIVWGDWYCPDRGRAFTSLHLVFLAENTVFGNLALEL